MGEFPTGLLFPEEHRAIELLGEVAGIFEKVTGRSNSRSSDLTEVTIHIHALQNMLLAQAGARAYPKLYRKLGTTNGNGRSDR